MKFSVISLAFIVGTTCTFSTEIKFDNFVVEGDESPVLVNEKEEERWIFEPRSESLPFGAKCIIGEGDCQCYGKSTECRCDWFGFGECTCRNGDYIVEKYKHRCSNKNEWSSEYATTGIPTTEGPKSIPIGYGCDRLKNDCQCYGKRNFCHCGPFGCVCTIGDKNVEYSKRNCLNKEEWEFEDGTTEIPTFKGGPKSLSLGNSCDRKKNNCQCYGKRGICHCGPFGCMCTIGDKHDEEIKRNCPNRGEWASEYLITEEPTEEEYINEIATEEGPLNVKPLGARSDIN